MDKKTAIRELESSSAHKRLRAARYLSKHSTQEDKEHIEIALRKESVIWVRDAMEKALARLGENANRVVDEKTLDEPLISDVTITEIHAKALEETTSLLLHEVRPIVGVLRLVAPKEINEYENSETKKQLNHLVSLLDAIANLREATAAPKMEEFDIAEMIEGIIQQESVDDHGIVLERAGPSPYPVIADRSLVSMAVANGIRNAIEATEVAEADNRQPIVVNWGQTDIDNWVTIIDQGIGLSANIEGAFDIGSSSKKGHLGMGLPTAKQAASSLGGNISIYKRKNNGVRFEFRWPKQEIMDESYSG